MRRIYLDHLAGTPLLPEVLEVMRPFLTDQWASPSSLHREGLMVRDALDRAHERVACLLNASSPEEVIFTSCGTEVANMAIKGVAMAGERHGRRIVTSSIEHPAVSQSIDWLEQKGFEIARLSVDRQGFIHPQDLKAALTEDTILVAVHMANHDIGTIQPVKSLAAICNEAMVPIFVDASFAGGWMPIDVQALGVNLLSLSPHRFHGPRGVGVLYKQRRTRMHNLLHGGMQEHGMRPGSENVPGIVGAGMAAELAVRDMASRVRHVGAMQQRFHDAFIKAVPDCVLNGPPPGPSRHVAHLNYSIPGVEGEGVMLRSDLKGVAFSSGTACVSKAMKASPVLQAMGVDAELALGSIRVSPGLKTTADEIDDAVRIISTAVADLRAMT